MFCENSLGCFLLLGGTSGETVVHVVARLSSNVFTVATPNHGRCGHRITCQHHPCLAAVVAALPRPSTTNLLRCTNKRNNLVACPIHHSLTEVLGRLLFRNCSTQFCLTARLRMWATTAPMGALVTHSVVARRACSLWTGWSYAY